MTELELLQKAHDMLVKVAWTLPPAVYKQVAELVLDIATHVAKAKGKI